MAMVKVTVNGEPREFADGTTVSRLLEELKIKPERVVVEINLTILKRKEHGGTVLTSGDHIEIVRFVGGGALSLGGAWPRG